MIFDDSKIPEEFRGPYDPMDMSSSDLIKLQNWVREPKGPLILHGKNGRGKSCGAVMILKWLCNQHFKLNGEKAEFEFTVLSELNQFWLAHMTQYWENFNRLTKLQNVEYLVIDDIGIKEPSPAFLDFVYTLINYRTNHQKTTIFTTNETSETLNKMFGSRIASRIFSGIHIEFIGSDKRLFKEEKNKSEQKESKLLDLYKEHQKQILEDKII